MLICEQTNSNVSNSKCFWCVKEFAIKYSIICKKYLSNFFFLICKHCNKFIVIFFFFFYQIHNNWTWSDFLFCGQTGVWFMHCHLEVHTSWGLKMAWVVQDGKGPKQKLPPPPSDLPKCWNHLSISDPWFIYTCTFFSFL